MRLSLAKRAKGVVSLAVSAVLAVGLLPVFPAQATAFADEVAAGEGGGEILVVLDEAKTARSGLSVESFTTDSVQSLRSAGVESSEVVIEDGEIGTVLKAEVSSDRTVDQAIEAVSRLPYVSYAQKNYTYKLIDSVPGDEPLSSGASEGTSEESAIEPLATTTNDEGLSRQYYLKDSASNGSNVLNAWDVARAEGTVTVAVLDTGAYVNHEDLAANLDTDNMWDACNHTERGTITSPYNPNGDVHGHGTHVAGIVAAEANNAKGIAGASYNARVLPIKVFDDSSDPGCRTSTLAEAYEYLFGLVSQGKVEGLHVINMSLGGYGLGEDDKLFESLINKAASDYDIVTVAAGGNGDELGNPLTDASYPSDFDACVSVTALDRNGGNVEWSDYNEFKDISAPGVSIYSTYNNSKSSYYFLSGTSMASPLVAGIFALLWSVEPSLSVDEAKAAVYETATPVKGSIDRTQPDYNGVVSGSHGAIDATAAVEYAIKNFNNDNTSSIRNCAADPVADQMYTGDALEPLLTIRDGEKTLELGKDYTVTYSHNVKVGEATALVKGIGDYVGFLPVSFKICYDMANVAIYNVKSSYVYEGEPIVIEPRAYYQGRVKLTEGTDYTYVVEGNDAPGTGRVVLTGMGDYRGTVEKTFMVKSNEVEPDPSEGKIDMSSAKFVGLAASYVYMGQPVIPVVNLMLGNTLLVQSVDYVMSIVDNETLGTATITAAGIGRYEGKATATFEIVRPTYDVSEFIDVPRNGSEWYTDYVYEAAKYGYLTGYKNADGTPTGYFGPNDALTRAQVATILYRACPTGSLTDTDNSSDANSVNKTPFPDVESGVFYTKAMNWAYANGILTGVDGKGEMQPNREITREELAVVMMRYAKSCGIAGADAEPSEEGITDWADVSSFAMSSIKWALANGVISGVDNLDGTRSLCPHDSASRAQMAKIILNVEAMRG